MGMKASAHSDARGALCSIRSQPSAAESCSPTATHGARPPPYALRPSADGPEQSRHSVHATECRDCSGAGVHDLQAHGGGLVLCAAQSCSVIVDSKVMVGRRRRHRAGVRRRRPQGQSSPLWPQWAAAWPLVQRGRRRQTRVRDDRVCDSTFSNVNVQMTRATSQTVTIVIGN